MVPVSQTQTETSQQIYRRLVVIYLQGSMVAVVVVMFLGWIGLELNATQWAVVLGAMPVAVASYIFPDIYLLRKHYSGLGAVLSAVDRGKFPPAEEIAQATVRALNLPYYSFMRVVLFHGPAATLTAPVTLFIGNALFHADFQVWQTVTFSIIIFLFAAPTHAVFEFFGVSRTMVPVIGRLYSIVGTLDRAHQTELRQVSLRQKLLFMAIGVTSLPMVFLAGSVSFKVGLLAKHLHAPESSHEVLAFHIWVFGVVAICVTGALMMTALMAAEVTRSAAQLGQAMMRVERGELDVRLQVTSTDEYADLFRGFNLMTEGLREEVQILGISQDLMGELQLDVLLERIMRATTDLLNADRSTLFLYDSKTNQLWSRFAEGLESRELRISPTGGIAGSVFTTGKIENIANAHADSRFNKEIDRRTGYHTQSILAIPVINRTGQRIGVTQVLNKRGGPFTAKDETRLKALTAQVAIALENAKLFDDVLRVQNYNESILRSTSNCMITLDGEGRVVTANDASFKLLKLERDAVINAKADALFAGPNEWVLDSLAKVQAAGETDLVVEAELRLPDTNVVSVNLTSVPLIDSNQRQIGSMLIFDDITDEKRVKSTMSRYMSKEVVDQLLHSDETALGGKVQRVTILFSDIRDFTAISELAGAKETVSMLNEYFGEMVDVIFRHGGILDKYIGDAMMALFGAPFNGPQDADNAVTVANNMIITLRALNQARARKGQRRIDIGVGVNTGDVVVGSIGSPKRMEYTAIGDSVNLASRLEGLCKVYGVNTILSEFTLREITRKPRLRELDFIRVKGKTQPVSVYEALGHHTAETFPDMERNIEIFSNALAAYRRRDWAGGIALFDAVLASHAKDVPSRLYRERCAHFAEEPPPEDWDGVWVHKEK